MIAADFDEDEVCEKFHLDNVFQRFKVVEFPVSFVGLSTTQELDVGMDLEQSAYLKTMCHGKLMKFKDAHNVSATHKAFNLKLINARTIEIIFKPLSECVSQNNKNKTFGNRFNFDLRLIRAVDNRCCNRESHAEVGRYYISGQYEYLEMSHHPKTLNFGDVIIKSTVTRHVRMRNDSKLIAAKISYVKTLGYDVIPMKFTIPPDSSKRLAVTIQPTSLKMGNTIMFTIRNSYDLSETSSIKSDDNFLSYSMTTELKVIYNKKPKDLVVQSLHTLHEPNPCYTYLNDELTTHLKRKETAYKFLQDSKLTHMAKAKIKGYTGKERCYSDPSLVKARLSGDLCKQLAEHASSYDLFNILLLPFTIKFGKIGLNTYGKQYMILKNKCQYEVTIRLLQDSCLLYTEEKLCNLKVKLKAFADMIVTIYCFGYVIGDHENTFKYVVENKYLLKHAYSVQVTNPTLMIQEKILKFGMVTSEAFVMYIPIRIFNEFNVPIDFQWEEIQPDTPYEIIPSAGTVPQHGCRLCEISYVCKPTKTKTHEICLVSKSTIKDIMAIELHTLTRKLLIKFIEQAVSFKEVALNIETVEKVRLENSSREVALFYVMEQIIPGITIKPMSGILRPKSIVTFEIIVKIACVCEFSFEIYVKINNKENIMIPVTGTIIEPKIVIQPKNIYLPRVPSGMISYIPLTIQNLGTLNTAIKVLDTGDENDFYVYVSQGNDKQRVLDFTIEGGQSKTVFIKVYDVFRRDYEMYIPFQINGLLGPPNQIPGSTEMRYYTGPFEELFEDNIKVRVKLVNKDISYCRINGVITVPWIQFSEEKFEIDYEPGGDNCIHFTMTNVSKYYLFVTISTSKLSPYFTLDVHLMDGPTIINETNIKFELDLMQVVEFNLKFHPKGQGKFVCVAPLFLDRYCALPFYNLTFFGRRLTPLMTPSTHRMIFPPCYVGTSISQTITLRMEAESNITPFTCSSKEEPNLVAKFVSCETFENGECFHTIVTVTVTVCCQIAYSRQLQLSFNHECGSTCNVEVVFCSTYCPMTLHAHSLVEPEANPYPYYPLSTQTELYEYLETCTNFLEKWMFQQGFRRDFFPVIPDSLHAISSTITSQMTVKNSKGINISFLNFIKRIAGPLMKHVRRVVVHGVDESFRFVKEIHDTYREIVHLLRSRGANLCALQAKYLLSYDQFVIFSENVASKSNAELIITQKLVADEDLYYRLGKQCWIDFILQSYKVFVLDSCFFDCVCVSSQPRDLVKVLIDWYNDHIMARNQNLRENQKLVKVVKNLTTDLSDGIAIISAFINYCPFMKNHFALLCELDLEDKEGCIINNACLIVDAMSQLRLYFPLSATDFLHPNFLHMLFLSVHLYITLPMFTPKSTIIFSPPLLRSSTRQLVISLTSQESLSFTQVVLNNTRNGFFVEKAPSSDNGKKVFLSVKYTANYIENSECTLLLHGYNKTRIFDTYITFNLLGQIGALNPFKKCKVTGPLYRPIKVDVLVSSPFTTSATYQVYLTDTEPTIPVQIETHKHSYFVRRLHLIEREITLIGVPKEITTESTEHKLIMQMVCLSPQSGNTWIWFRSEIGDFFIKVTTQVRWDLATDTLQVKVECWPMDPCSCGEACECYRTAVLMIPHRNELMVRALRHALLEHTSDLMMKIFDQLIESSTGKVVLHLLLAEGGTNMMEVKHILREQTTYHVASRSLMPRIDTVTLSQHTDCVLALPVTIQASDKSEKYSVTFSSDCGMDVRTYRILFFVQNT